MIDARTQITLSYLEALHDADLERHAEIILARKYHEGKQATKLTERLADFLGTHGETYEFRLNVCRGIVEAVAQKLKVTGFKSNEKPTSTSGPDGEEQNEYPIAKWAYGIWQKNRMDEKARFVHGDALRDSEAFVVVDWNSEGKYPRLTWHQRYTSTEANEGDEWGDGQGVWMVYPDDDVTQPALCAVQEWIENYDSGLGNEEVRARRTVYYPDKIVRYHYSSGWQLHNEPGRPATSPNLAPDGTPLGIPVFHFKNIDLRPEALEAIGMQDAINKTVLDILGITDQAGFPVYGAKGFTPTTDGQEVSADGSNALKVAPGMTIAPIPTDGDFFKLEGSDPTSSVNWLIQQVTIVAMITGTPLSRFVMTKQIAGEGTLKEQETPLQEKVEDRQVLFGNAWEDAMLYAYKLNEFYGAEKFGMPAEELQFSTKWRTNRTLDELLALQKLKFPDEILWEMYGLEPEEIEKAKKTEQYQARMELTRGAMGGTPEKPPQTGDQK